MVYFFDAWYREWSLSNNIYFGFYATCKIGKEKNLKDDLPHCKKPILELLTSKKKLSEDVVEYIKNKIVGEYKKQYAKKSSDNNLDELKSLSNDDFVIFLNSIDWKFEKENEDQLRKKLLMKVVGCKYYNSYQKDLEDYILSKLADKIEAKQNADNDVSRYIHSAEIELIFTKANPSNKYKKRDSSWKSMEKANQDIEDKRTIEEKIFSVCKDYDKKQIKRMIQKTCHSKLEENDSDEKDFKSFKWRIYTCCINEFNSFINENSDKEITQEKIDEFISSLNTTVCSHISGMSQAFTYPPMNEEHSKIMIEGAILDLIDNCHLAFD